MARIAGVDLPREKRSDIGLTYVFGIGRAAARYILGKAGIDGAVRVKDLSEDQIVKIREIIDQDYQVEGDLRKTFSMNIKRSDRHRHVSRASPSQGPAGSRSTVKNQCTHEKRPSLRSRKQAETSRPSGSHGVIVH